MKKTPAHLESLFQALGDRTRLRLLNLMADGEVCVCFFVEVLGEPQPKISRHLGVLRAAGLVAARREGKWMHYGATFPDELAPLFETLVAALRADPEMIKDRAALARACCSPRVPELLKRAPKPVLL
ncbi:MAG TPA: metalloregulator ArsR/SmtB family transcription factor [Thermoanaerobaculia bacterium]|jgi:ArsR family transcriptional regulator